MTQTSNSISSGNVTVTFDSNGSGGNLGENTYTDCGVRVTDATGNESSLVTASSFTVDTTDPTLTSVSITSTNSDNEKATTGDTISVSFSSDESLYFDPTVTIAGKTATISGGPTLWVADYTLSSSEAQGTAAITIDGFDRTNVNALAQATSTTDATLVVIDTIKPTLTEVTAV